MMESSIDPRSSTCPWAKWAVRKVATASSGSSSAAVKTGMDGGGAEKGSAFAALFSCKTLRAVPDGDPKGCYGICTSAGNRLFPPCCFFDSRARKCA